jgi:hypothetical protein
MPGGASWYEVTAIFVSFVDFLSVCALCLDTFSAPDQVAPFDQCAASSRFCVESVVYPG